MGLIGNWGLSARGWALCDSCLLLLDGLDRDLQLFLEALIRALRGRFISRVRRACRDKQGRTLPYCSYSAGNVVILQRAGTQYLKCALLPQNAGPKRSRVLQRVGQPCLMKCPVRHALKTLSSRSRSCQRPAGCSCR